MYKIRKNVVLPKVRSESGRKAFSFQGAIIFNKVTDEMKSRTLILRFKTLCRNFNFDFLLLVFFSNLYIF